METKTNVETASYEDMAVECTNLMNQVEQSGYAGSSAEGDPRMVRIMEIANILAWFKPELLDQRFTNQ